MRVLFSCLPAYGHLQPMVPLAAACKRSGHEVVVATGPDMAERVRRLGFNSADVGPTREEGDRLVRRAPADAVTAAPMRRLWDNYTFVHRIPTDGARLRGADLVPLVRDWQADIVVHDVTDFAAPLAAALAGVPSALHSWGVPVPSKLMARAGAKAAPLWREAGLEPQAAGGMFRGLYIDLCPPSLWPQDVGEIYRAQALAPLAAPEPWLSLPDAVRGLPHDRTVHVTLGTVANRAIGTFHLVVSALVALGVNVVVTVGPDQAADVLGPQPPQVVVVSYLPISLLLPHCDLVVAHGGSGTMLAALRQGLPQLLVPYDADNVRNARLCEAAGVAAVIPLAELDEQGVRREVTRLLDDVAARQAARRLQAEIEAMPSPEVVVPALELLAGHT